MDGVEVHFDGASISARGRPQAGWGFTIEGEGLDHEEMGVVDRTRDAGPGGTNNVAEYTAAIRALEYLVSTGYEGPVTVLGDSQLVVRQFNGEYAVRASHLKPLHETLLRLSRRFAHVDVFWVPREENRRADYLSKMALRGT